MPLICHSQKTQDGGRSWLCFANATCWSPCGIARKIGFLTAEESRSLWTIFLHWPYLAVFFFLNILPIHDHTCFKHDIFEVFFKYLYLDCHNELFKMTPRPRQPLRSHFAEIFQLGTAEVATRVDVVLVFTVAEDVFFYGKWAQLYKRETCLVEDVSYKSYGNFWEMGLICIYNFYITVQTACLVENYEVFYMP